MKDGRVCDNFHKNIKIRLETKHVVLVLPITQSEGREQGPSDLVVIRVHRTNAIVRANQSTKCKSQSRTNHDQKSGDAKSAALNEGASVHHCG